MSVQARSLVVVDVPEGARTRVFRAPGVRVLTLREDTCLDARIVDEAAPERGPRVRFPAPWPALLSGEDCVSPDLSYAVFVGPHSVRAVAADGTPRWELFHQCRTRIPRTFVPDEETPCPCDRDTDVAETGSAHITPDGKLVWAHVATPLAQDPPETPIGEAWLLLDAVDASVIHRLDLPDLFATQSHHVPHPDGQRVAVCLGSDPYDVTVLWGSWNGHEATTRRAETAPGLVLCDISPDGDEYVTLDLSTDNLTRRRVADDSELTEIDYTQLLPHPDADDAEEPPVWDQMCGYLNATTLLASTAELDDQWGHHRHWTISTTDPTPREITYPIPVFGAPIPLGDNTWLTRMEEAPQQLRLWTDS
ncbi:hypothetical protein [Embleya sp. NPDC005575]|uniref:hypothetical protein n=1 Tax=Embleya sp. NPDC005575 TaxID=3156892 RepID=UPI0033BF6612